MPTTYAYLRVSSIGQANDGRDGFPRQREVCETYAAANRLTISQTFEEAYTGTEWEDRPALTNLLSTLQAGDTVLVERADRVARDFMISEVMLKEFRDLGAKVIVAESGTDLTNDDSPSATLIRHILAAVSQWERSSIVAKLRSARARKKATTGRCEGRKPFGDLPGEQETLQAIVSLRDRGNSLAEIAASLNANGQKTRQGKPWHPGTIGGILRSLNKVNNA